MRRMKIHYKLGKPPVWWYMALTALVAILLLSGCKEIQYLPQETKVETKIEYRDRIQRDTCYVHDSCFIQAHGDTIFVDRYKYIYKEKIRLDTAYICNVDTITILKPIEIEKKLSRWDGFKIKVGGYSLTFLSILLLMAIGYVIYRFSRR